MKNLIYIISLYAAAICLSACEGLLIEKPKTVAAETFYNTAEEVETAVNAIYSPIRATRAEQIVVLDAHSDWGYGRGSRAQYNDFAGFNATNFNAAGARWNSFYQAIRNANLVIFNTPNGSNISQPDINYNLAEARFLRALCYFDLVRNWGGVPLRIEDNMRDIDLPRSSEEQVYELILSDLIFAEGNLRETAKHIGRPTTYAAKTMLADVYLQLGRYQEASQKAAEVIQSGKYSLVQVNNVADYQQNLYGPELITSSEEIFYFKYAREIGQGNFMLFILNHPSTGQFNFGGAYAHYSDATNPFYMEWEDLDIRKQFWDKVNFGLGPNTLVSRKYTDLSAVSNSGAGNDLPIYRYAEVLLLFAEATVRQAGTVSSEALNAINQVKRRAYGYPAGTSSPVDFEFSAGQTTEFLDAVLQERAYEFQFEGKRWLDLKRTGRAQEFLTKNKGITIAPAHYLWPIPLDEINFNGAIDPSTDQNPGY